MSSSVSMIGLDTAKAAFLVHGIDETGRAVLTRKLRRDGVVAFFAAQPACTVYTFSVFAGFSNRTVTDPAFAALAPRLLGLCALAAGHRERPAGCG